MKMKLFTILSVLILAASVMASTITSGLINRWQFDEISGIVANDTVGSNPGTLYGAADFISDSVKTSVLNVYGFSGEVDMAPVEPAVGTITVWVNPATKEIADIARQDTDLLIQENSGGVFYAYALRISNGQPVAILANDIKGSHPNTKNYSSQTVLSGPNSIKVGVWTSLAMRFDGSTLSLFVNGRQVASTPYIAEPGIGLSYHGTLPLKVAAAIYDQSIPGQLEYTGKLSDLRIYNRALSNTEIQGVVAGQ